jgi:hypothetical protein
LDKISTIAKLNILCKENNLNPQIVHLFKSAVNTSLFCLKNIDDLLLTPNCYDVFYGMQSLSTIAKNFPDDTKQLLQLFEDFLKQDFLFEQELCFFNVVRDVLIKELAKIEKEGFNIEEELGKYAQEFYKILFADNKYSLLPEFLIKFDECYTMAEKKAEREKEISEKKNEVQQEH